VLIWRAILTLTLLLTVTGAHAQEHVFTSPQDKAVSIRPDASVQWNRVDGAEAYYLYVGTQPGAKDIWDSGETHQLSYRGSPLPPSQTLHARLNVRSNGTWSREFDITFTTAGVAAFIYPRDGATAVGLGEPFQWTAVPGVRTYRLVLGSAQGRSDYLDAEVTGTSYLVSDLPRGRPVFARVITSDGADPSWTDISFEVPAVAKLTYPAARTAVADSSRPFEWTAAPGADAYHLWVGTRRGSNDLVDSTETTRTTYDVFISGPGINRRLPAGVPLYARLHTRIGGVTLFEDIEFSVARVAAGFVAPTDGAIGVSSATTFRWTRVPDAHATFRLSVGTTPGGNELLETGELTRTSYGPVELAGDGPRYARIWTKSLGEWRYEDAVFTVSSRVQPARIEFPGDGALNADIARPFQWSDVALARGYRLRIGTTPGGDDLHDSGIIRVTKRFVSDIPAGVPLFGRVETLINGEWHHTEFSFTAARQRSHRRRVIEAARWATQFVREMADLRDFPFKWTELASVSKDARSYCTDYALTLLSVLSQMNIPRAQPLYMSFTRAESHVAVEVFDEASGKWIVLDPTFAVAPRRMNEWATAEDIHQATLEQDWDRITYEPLGRLGSSLASAYHIDYPLLYLNISHGDPDVPVDHSSLPYLREVVLPLNENRRSLYLVQCLEGASAAIRVDDVAAVMPCGGVDSTSAFFDAVSIRPVADAAPIRVWTPRRYVFQPFAFGENRSH
jgi:hypothetical protein